MVYLHTPSLIPTQKAFVTLAMRDNYAFGCLVLGNSLRKLNTKHDVVVMVTDDLSADMRDMLLRVFDEVIRIPILDGTDSRIHRPDLSSSLTKIECWNLTKYSNCVFLDCDTMLLQNCDELLNMDELSAAPDVGWPDCFNTGVFVFKPSNFTYEALITMAREIGSFDGGEQGLLNQYFGKDWRSNLNKRLSFVYNAVVGYIYTHSPAFKQFGSMTKIAHFIGHPKPWLANWNFLDGYFLAHYLNPETQHPFLQLWLDIFQERIYKQLPEIYKELASSGNIHTVWNLFLASKTPELHRTAKEMKTTLPIEQLYTIPLRTPPVYFEPPPPSYYLSKIESTVWLSSMPVDSPPPLPPPLPPPPPPPPPMYRMPPSHPQPLPPTSPSAHGISTYKELTPAPAFISLTSTITNSSATPPPSFTSRIMGFFREPTKYFPHYPALPPLTPEFQKYDLSKLDLSKLPPSQLARIKGRIKAREDDAARQKEKLAMIPPPLAGFEELSTPISPPSPPSLVRTTGRPLLFVAQPPVKKRVPKIVPSPPSPPSPPPLSSDLSSISPRSTQLSTDEDEEGLRPDQVTPPDAERPIRALQPPPPPPPTPEIDTSPSTSGMKERKHAMHKLDDSDLSLTFEEPSDIRRPPSAPPFLTITEADQESLTIETTLIEGSVLETPSIESIERPGKAPLASPPIVLIPTPMPSRQVFPPFVLRPTVTTPIPIRPQITERLSELDARPPALTYAPLTTNLPIEIESESVLATFMDSAVPMSLPPALDLSETSVVGPSDTIVITEPRFIMLPSPTPALIPISDINTIRQYPVPEPSTTIIEEISSIPHDIVAPMPPVVRLGAEFQVPPYRQSLHELQTPQYSESVQVEFRSDSASPIRATSQARRQTIATDIPLIVKTPSKTQRLSQGSETFRADDATYRSRQSVVSETPSSSVEPGSVADSTRLSQIRKRSDAKKRKGQKGIAPPKPSTVTLHDEKKRLEGKSESVGSDKFENIQKKLAVLIKERKLEDEEDTEDELDIWEHEDEEFYGDSDEDISLPDSLPPTPQTPLETQEQLPTDLPGYRMNDFSGMREWESGQIDYSGPHSSDSIMRRLDFLFSRNSNASGGRRS